MKRVAVLSCAHFAWLESSMVMGHDLARAMGEVESHIHVPVDKEGLAACLADADALVVHTHGSAHGFFDQRADGRQTVIASLEDIAALPPFPSLRFVLITACGAAGEEENIAATFSRRISPDGLVIANRYAVWGGSREFTAESGARGWVGYRNGAMVLGEYDIPASLSMAEAYRVYERFSVALKGDKG